MKKIFLLIVFALALTRVYAATYYWVGGVGTAVAPVSWNTATNWSTTSGTGTGTPSTGDGAVPGSGDIAVFDAATGNVNPFVDVTGLTISITQLQISPAAAATNTVSFVGTASSFTISGDLTLSGVKPASTVYSGVISDYGNNTITVQGNIITGAYNSTLVTVPATNANTTAGKIALTGANPIIQAPVSPAAITATVSSGAVTALNITNGGGSGYFSTPTLTFYGGGGSNAAATVTVTNGVITGYTISNAGSGYTSAPTVVISYGGNLGFQNLDISQSTNLSLPTATLQINGNLNIQSGGKLTLSNSLILNSTAPSGQNPFNSPGTITGSGVIVPLNNTAFRLFVQGTLPASYTMTSPQTVGTFNFDPTVSTIANGISFTRPSAVSTIGTCNSSLFNVSGNLTLNSGIIDDGGNTLAFGFYPTIGTTNTTAGNAIHRGTGRIRAQRTSSSNIALVTAGKTVTVGNIEIGSSSTGTKYPVGSGTNLTVNGTFTFSKSGSGIDASGSTITFQNADVPIVLGSGVTLPIVTSNTTNLIFGAASNTGGAAFTIPASTFSVSPTLINNLTINRTNNLTFNSQAITASGAVSISGTGTVAFPAATSVTGTTTVNSGATLATAAAYTATGGLTVNGAIQQNTSGSFSGTITYNTGSTLNFNATSNTESLWPSASGPTNVNIMQSSLTLTSNKSLSGTLTIGSSSTPALTINSGVVLTFSNGATINHAGTGTVTFTSGGNTSGFKYGNSSSDRVNLVFSNTSGTARITSVETAVVSGGGGLGSLTVNGNGGTCGINSTTYLNNGLTIARGATLDLTAGYSLVLAGGNWNNDGTFIAHTPSTSNLTFQGTGQTINNTNTGSETFNNFIYNKSAGTLTLNANVTVANVLTLTAGNIILGSKDLTIGSSGSIAGGSTSSYVATTGSGKLIQTGGDGVTLNFPIGAAASGSYDPATLTPTTGTTFSVKVSSTLTNTLDESATHAYVNPREWTLTPASPSSTSVTLKPSAFNALYAGAAYNVIGSGFGTIDGVSNYSFVSATNSSDALTATFSAFNNPFVTGRTDLTVANTKPVSNQTAIYTSQNSVVVDNAKGNVEIYAASGQLVRSLKATSDRLSIALDKGMYIVKNGSKATKVMIQ